MSYPPSTLAREMFAEKPDLAYLVLPVPDDRPRLAVRGVKDHSEYEFQNLGLTPGVLAAVLRQASERAALGQYVFISLAIGLEAPLSGTAATKARLCLRQLDIQAAVLMMAQALVGEFVGGHELGAYWGDGVAAVIDAVKKTESLLLQAIRLGSKPDVPQPDSLVEKVALLREAVLPDTEDN